MPVQSRKLEIKKAKRVILKTGERVLFTQYNQE
jgi:hypothetical protein